MFCCLRSCLNGNIRKSGAAANRIREPEIHLDAASAGPEVILLSNNLRITGTGGALATAPLVQSKSYFEIKIKIQQSGSWSVGLATQKSDLSKKFGGCDKESWCLCSDNATRHNNEEVKPVVATYKSESIDDLSTILNGNALADTGLVGIEDIPEEILLSDKNFVNKVITTPPPPLRHNFPDEGDIVGVAFDHVELNFYFNGKNLEVPFRNVKGTVYPVVYVSNGTVVDIILENFNYGPPPGFDKIMIEQSLL